MAIVLLSVGVFGLKKKLILKTSDRQIVLLCDYYFNSAPLNRIACTVELIDNANKMRLLSFTNYNKSQFNGLIASYKIMKYKTLIDSGNLDQAKKLIEELDLNRSETIEYLFWNIVDDAGRISLEKALTEMAKTEEMNRREYTRESFKDYLTKERDRIWRQKKNGGEGNKSEGRKRVRLM
ncbi:hypothetical protein CKA38_12045 [Ereboglobus luteus]|uniref:Uncharacterized protein n=1 Tax=Ereboglobus luteus TaxID=1796921 RepID=A0A2U8E4U4_9BACT|nr:hypothetical protein CKA38_12045 [Ereboglobus luteus]